jgi:hypothetical protein
MIPGFGILDDLWYILKAMFKVATVSQCFSWLIPEKSLADGSQI